MVQQRMWSSQSPLRQFKSISKDILLKLEKKNLAWKQYYDLSAHELGEVVRDPKQGGVLHKLIHQVPKLDLTVRVLPVTRSLLKVDLKITPDFLWDEKVHGCAEPFWIIVEDHDGERLLHYEYFVLKMQHMDKDHTLSFTVPIIEPMPPNYYIRLLSDRWLGSDATLPVSFKHVRLPEKSLPPTELLDLQPLPISALKNPAFETLFQQFSYFNSLQTQVFNALYNTDDSALIAAPVGSGKTICSEFAVMRMLKEEGSEKNGARCVYIAPVEALAKERYCDWEDKFGKGLGYKVSKLTGDTTVDLEILKESQIIISTPETWDSLSRRWKQQKHVQQISLLIVDEAHLLESQVGSVLEVIISRMRLMSSMTGKSVRFVALSSSLANAKDMGEWIGASSRNHFNIPPGVQPNPLDIVFQEIDITSVDSCLQSMIRFTHSVIVKQTPAKPAIVFVPTRKYAQLTASELITYSCADGRAENLQFPRCKRSFVAPFLEKVSDTALVHCLSEGVGYLHENLSDLEQEIVCQLFTAGAIQVCIASHKMCWGLTLVAPLVVVMGTKHFDEQEMAQRDYPVSDLLQMLGRASQASSSHPGKCIIFCHASKLDYYKKFLYEPLPIESHLDYYLHDYLNAEIAAGTIKNKQDAVDLLTWTYMYRRLPRNPNYYNLQGTGHSHLSEHLSELVETILNDLEASHCIEIIDEMDVQPLSFGLIASYHYISYSTVELFSKSLTANTKLRGLLNILASASEYWMLPVRPGEEDKIRYLMNHQRFGISKPKYSDPHVKANVLLQSHFSRDDLTPALALDQKHVLLDANRLVQAMVDVMSSNGWLSPALAAMEISQMVTQGLWENDSALLQLPHFTEDHVKRCQDNPGRRIETVFELVELEDDKRRQLLQMTDAQISDVARACNRYPNIDVMYEIVGEKDIKAGGHVIMRVSLERELDSKQEVGPVDAPRFPKPKQESWWLVIGDPEANHLLAIKKVSLQRKAQIKLKFSASRELGKKSYTLYLMCDAYLGCDQEYEFSIDVKQPDDSIHVS